MYKPGNEAWNRTKIDDEQLLKLYVSEKMSAKNVAKLLGVGVAPIYRRLKELGITRNNSEAHVGIQSKENNPNWKGGRHFAKSGYVIVTDERGVTAREHRIVAEKMLGRKLMKSEVVHHKNGNGYDNRPENLEIINSQSEHMKIHMTTDEARRRGMMTKRSKAALLAVLNL